VLKYLKEKEPFDVEPFVLLQPIEALMLVTGSLIFIGI
jgi:hypothetical protein